MLAVADADGARAAALVWTLVYTGLRVSELLTARVGDLAEDLGEPVLWVRLKGGQRHRAVLTPEVRQRIQAYLTERTDTDRLPTRTVAAGPGPLLFATRTGGRLHTVDLRRLLQRLARTAGLPPAVAGRLSPHVLRATYITHALQQPGVQVLDVRKAVGQKSVQTTERYDRSHLDPKRHPSHRLRSAYHPQTVAAGAVVSKSDDEDG
jgi:integrase